VYSGRPLPAKKDRSKKKEGDKEKDKERKEKVGSDKEKTSASRKPKEEKADQTGTFRTNSQGVYGEDLALDPDLVNKAPAEKRKVDPNSALARRLAAAGKVEPTAAVAQGNGGTADDFVAFPASSPAGFSADFGDHAFGEFDAKVDESAGAFGAFDVAASGDAELVEAFSAVTTGGSEWGSDSKENAKFDAFSTFSPQDGGVERTEGNSEDKGESAAGDDEDGDPEAGADVAESARRPRRSSKSKSSSSSDGGESNESDKGKRGQLRRTRSGARRHPKSDGKAGGDSDDLAAMTDVQGEVGDDGKPKRAPRVSSRSRKKEGSRRTTTGSDEAKDLSDKARRESKHAPTRSSSSRKPHKNKDDEDKLEP
jgi:hypothetical protein